MKKAVIFDIKRFAVHDGTGIRTTVFFKGCPLKCLWCHNPEGISPCTQLAYYAHKCITCGECISACEKSAHMLVNGIHTFDRNLCRACGKCEKVCHGEALKLYGKEVTIAQLLPELLEDRDFYDSSGGGVTLSGGECLLQADFCAELLKELKLYGIHTAIDTCGCIPKTAIDRVLPYVDVFLYDIKAYDKDVHIKCTGQSNETILENLRYIDNCGKNIEIRIPYVPNFNSDQIEKIARFLSSFKNVSKVKILAYHNYASSKYAALGMQDTLPIILPEKSEIDAAIQIMKNYSLYAC